MDNTKITQLEQEVLKLQKDLEFLRTLVYKDNFSDNQIFGKRIIFNKTVALNDSADIATGTSTGTKIATSSSQKLGFYGATPIVRAAAISQPSGGATVDSQARSAISSIITVLQNLGLTA